MILVKNVFGLAVLLGVFGLGFLFFVAALIFGMNTLFSGGLGLIALVTIVTALGGIYMFGGVLVLFARNFSFGELMITDSVAERAHAPVAVEVRYDNEKKQRYLVDTRHSPRLVNPKVQGRGVFVMSRKRGTLVTSDDVVTLVNSNGSNIKNIRNVGDKIHMDFINTGRPHTLTIVSITEFSTSFNRKDSWEPLAGKIKTKEQVAEAWTDSLKKA